MFTYELKILNLRSFPRKHRLPTHPYFASHPAKFDRLASLITTESNKRYKRRIEQHVIKYILDRARALFGFKHCTDDTDWT